jgi:hypothetical protein
MLALAIEEHDVGQAGEGIEVSPLDRSGVLGGVDGGMRRIELAAGGTIEVEAARTGMGHGAAGGPVGLTWIDHDDLGGWAMFT